MALSYSTYEAPVLDQKQLIQILRYTPETGEFFWRASKGRQLAGDRAGYPRKDGYWFIKVAQRKYCAHRLAWLYMTGSWPAQLIDHIDGNPSNNRWSNLRDVSPARNGHNRRGAQRNNKLGVLGVSVSANGQYVAYISINGKHINLGGFPSIKLAAEAYADAKNNTEVLLCVNH